MLQTKRGPGRPPLAITKIDPLVPIDVRRSTRLTLHTVRQGLEQGQARKFTLDDVVQFLLTMYAASQSVK